jgi:ABC-type transporter Mla subunit MlaD
MGNTNPETEKPISEFKTQNLDSRMSRLESIVEQIGEAVIATTETVERLAERVDVLAVQIQHQVHQVQQQGYQIFAVSDALKTLVDSQGESKVQLDQLIDTLQRLITAIKTNQE